MTGKYKVIIQDKRLKYEFFIRRNITIIRGNSATGKTTLIEMIAAYEREKEKSGIELSCDCECTVLDSADWKGKLERVSGKLVFIDECYSFTASEEFAEAVKHSDNYFIIVAREGIANLPYSVEEIYGIRTSGHYSGLKQTYNFFYRLYGDYRIYKDKEMEKVIVEDSNSGYEFFSEVFKDKTCISAQSKSNIPGLLKREADKIVLVIADGAAFGSEMEKIERIVESGGKIVLYLPESFEWLILKSGLIDGNRIQKILEQPEQVIDSKKYFSWEQYFTQLLISETRETYLKYQKKALNPVYLHEKERKEILKEMNQSPGWFSDWNQPQNRPAD